MSDMSFNALPPIDIPFRFFVTAIAFMMGLAVFVFWTGESLWLSRWHPSMLALTHGFTLGFITPVMMGALLQMLPVVAGVGLNNVQSIGRFCYPVHFIGTGLLMWGFVAVEPMQYSIKILAIICLGLSFTYYIFSIVRAIIQYSSQQLHKSIVSHNPTVMIIGYSILALFITVILGIIIQMQSAGFMLLPTIYSDKALTNIHALWGGIGWIALLILAVSLQVIPMFHVAPSFPPFSAKLIPVILLLSLINMLIFPHLVEPALNVLLVMFLLFNFVLLHVISRRKRKIPDMSINAWRLAAYALSAIVVLYYFPEHWLPEIVIAKKSLLLSAAFLYFYLLTIILGMLCKILPFLSYTHLQQRCLTNFDGMKFLPNMHDLLNKKSAGILFYCHVFTGASLMVTVINPQFYLFFSGLLMIEFSVFFTIILKTCLVYRSSSLKIKQIDNGVVDVNLI